MKAHSYTEHLCVCLYIVYIDIYIVYRYLLSALQYRKQLRPELNQRYGSMANPAVLIFFGRVALSALPATTVNFVGRMQRLKQKLDAYVSPTIAVVFQMLKV